MKNYQDLAVYKHAFELAIKVHKMTLSLPKHELYETGSQLRRASKSIKSNIVEGYGRRVYKQEFIRFLVYAEASLLETESDLGMLHVLYPDLEVEELLQSYSKLGKKLHTFTNWVRANWKTNR